MTASGSLGSLTDVFESSVSLHADRPLFLTKRDGRWVVTQYREFARLVDSVRAGLAGLGVRAGDRVGIISANRVEWAAVAYASYGLRAAVVPMYRSATGTGLSCFETRGCGCCSCRPRPSIGE